MELARCAIVTALRSRDAPLLVKHLDRVAITRTLVAIEKMPEDSIREVVQRVPSSHLSDEQKVTLCEGLVGRRSLVAPALKAVL
jgi:hypothetical protein